MLRRQQQLLVETPFGQVVIDPVFNSLHIAILRATGAAAEHDARSEQLQRAALYDGPSGLTQEEKLALLADEEALRWLHRQAWSRWPLEWLEEVAQASRCAQTAQLEPLCRERSRILDQSSRSGA